MTLFNCLLPCPKDQGSGSNPVTVDAKVTPGHYFPLDSPPEGPEVDILRVINEDGDQIEVSDDEYALLVEQVLEAAQARGQEQRADEPEY